MSADDVYRLLVLLTWPAALLYPLIYGTLAPWYRSGTGRALFAKATGVGLMVSFAALFILFGPDYVGRSVFRIVGMSLVLLGTWGALIAMLHRLHKGAPRP